MNSKYKRILTISVLVMMTLQMIHSTSAAPNYISTSRAEGVNVLVLTQNTNGAFEIRLRLDKKAFNISYAVETNYSLYTDKLATYAVIIVNSFMPEDASFIGNLTQAVKVNGTGLFFWGGYYPVLTTPIGVPIMNLLPVEFDDPFTVEDETYIDQSWVSQIELKVNPNYKFNDKLYNDPKLRENFTLIQRNIVWESSPLVKERIFVKDAKMEEGAKVLVYKPEQGRAKQGLKFRDGEPLVVYNNYSNGRVIWVSMGVGKIEATFKQYETTGVGPYWNRTEILGSSESHDAEWNKAFYLWPYFNFFLYQTTMFLAKKDANQINTYAQWPYSPIPHQNDAIIWMLFIAGLWIFNFVLFFSLGRKKRIVESSVKEDEGKKGEKDEKEGKGGEDVAAGEKEGKSSSDDKKREDKGEGGEKESKSIEKDVKDGENSQESTDNEEKSGDGETNEE
ncbi:MAG: hypothetical protein ACTSXU_07580 [Promethearchaeota archaeon]